jgi:hypothetical protein
MVITTPVTAGVVGGAVVVTGATFVVPATPSCCNARVAKTSNWLMLGAPWDRSPTVTMMNPHRTTTT